MLRYYKENEEKKFMQFINKIKAAEQFYLFARLKDVKFTINKKDI